jgi:CRISPR-associated protein Csh1
MIEALYQIGRVQEEKGFLEEYFEDIGDNYKHVFKIVFNIDDPGDITYKEVCHEDYKSDFKLKYFYKKGSSRGTDFTPTSKITALGKTSGIKLFPSVKAFIASNKTFFRDEDSLFLNNLQKSLEANRVTITRDLFDLTRDQMEVLNENEGIKDGGIITLVFEKEGKIHFIGDMEVFKNTFLNQKNEAYRRYFYSKTRNEECRSFNKTCYICKEIKPEVWGLVGTFNSYTLDKPGMVTSGFNQENAWKNYPVCPECAIVLERGKKFIESHLRHRFCGFNYFIIPQLSVTDDEALKKVLNRLKDRYEQFSLQEKTATRIKRQEEKIIEFLSEEKNFINFNLLFFREEQSGSVFNILLNLLEIAPTRFRQMIQAKTKVDEMDDKKFKIFESIYTSKDNKEISFDFSFAFIRGFFLNSRIEGNFDRDFLAVVNNIFIGNRISYSFLLKRFMSKFRYEFVNDGFLDFHVIRAYKILLFIEHLKLLDRRSIKVEESNRPYNDFFKENPILDEDTKKAVFLEGVLADKLLNIQYAERNSKPFRSRLNGLRIDERVAKRIFPEMINKLEEYNKNYFRNLEEAIGVYMGNADFPKFSVDELSFYFTMGMTLANKLIPKKGKEKENETENQEEGNNE